MTAVDIRSDGELRYCQFADFKDTIRLHYEVLTKTENPPSDSLLNGILYRLLNGILYSLLNVILYLSSKNLGVWSTKNVIHFL
jgi:hypothetical protein